MREWKDIPEFEGVYRISSDGEVMSVASNEILKLYYVGTGKYRMVRLYKGGKGKEYTIHRLVARTFLGEPNIVTTQRIEVNHINGNKEDNRVENLEWCTHGQNQAHAYRTGLKPSVEGELHPGTRLTNSIVAKIKSDRANGVTRKEIMAKYGLSKSETDSLFYTGNWKNVMI